MIKKSKTASVVKENMNFDSMDGTAAKIASPESIQTWSKDSDKTKKERQSLLEDFKPLNFTQQKRDSEKKAISLVYAKTGKRVTLLKDLLEHLPLGTDSVQIGYSDECLLISNYIDDNYTSYKLNSLGKNQAVYSSALIHSIVNRYELDYSTCSSLSFPIKKVIKEENKVLIVIDIISNNTNEGDFNHD